MKSVTQIVWEVFPFEWPNPNIDYFAQALSFDKLKDKIPEMPLMSIAERARHLDKDNALRVLNIYGTFAHRMAKQISKWMDVIVHDPILAQIRDHLIAFFKDYDIRPILNEWTFVIPDEYSGTLDMVCEIRWKSVRRICILDFKTYGLYKILYWIPFPEEERKKTPTKKLKHVGLQTSLYGDAYRRLHPDYDTNRGHMLLLAWLTPEWVMCYELEDDLSPYHNWLRKSNWKQDESVTEANF